MRIALDWRLLSLLRDGAARYRVSSFNAANNALVSVWTFAVEHLHVQIDMQLVHVALCDVSAFADQSFGNV